MQYLRQMQSDIKRWSLKDTEVEIWRRQTKFWFQLCRSVGWLRSFQMCFIHQQAQWFWSLSCLLCWICMALGNLMKLPSFNHTFLGCQQRFLWKAKFYKMPCAEVSWWSTKLLLSGLNLFCLHQLDWAELTIVSWLTGRSLGKYIRVAVLGCQVELWFSVLGTDCCLWICNTEF